jgi:hypothetical protein
MEKQNTGFIQQTANDYDMPYSIVKMIYDKYYPEQFYERLEMYIKDRANN